MLKIRLNISIFFLGFIALSYAEEEENAVSTDVASRVSLKW